MPHDVIPTTKIADPEKAGDYLLINSRDYNPAIHELFAEPRPVRTEEEVVGEQVAAGTMRASEGLDLTVSKLGVWLAEETDVAVLELMLELEERKSALVLIQDRIRAIREGR